MITVHFSSFIYDVITFHISHLFCCCMFGVPIAAYCEHKYIIGSFHLHLELQFWSCAQNVLLQTIFGTFGIWAHTNTERDNSRSIWSKCFSLKFQCWTKIRSTRAMLDTGLLGLSTENKKCDERQGYVKQQIGPIYSYIDKHNSIQFDWIGSNWIDFKYAIHIFRTCRCEWCIRVAFLALIQNKINAFKFIHSFIQMAINNKHFFLFSI